MNSGLVVVKPEQGRHASALEGRYGVELGEIALGGPSESWSPVTNQKFKFEQRIGA